MASENNVFLVESPLQLKNYLMIRNSNIIKDEDQVYVIVRLNNNKNCSGMLKKLIDDYNLSGNSYYFYAAKGSRLKLVFSTLKLIWMLKFKFRNSVNLYIGDHRSKWMSMLSSFMKINLVNYIDDGMATVVFYNELISKKRIMNDKSRILTTFNISSCEHVPVLNISIDKTHIIADESLAAVIGMPMIESKAMSSDNYFSYLQKVVSHAKKSGFDNIIYIPHRNENVELLSTKYKALGLKVNPLSLPIENWFLETEMPPSRVYSLYSTAIVNIDSIYSGIECYSFRPSEFHFDIKFREGINTVYDYIENNSRISMI